MADEVPERQRAARLDEADRALDRPDLHDVADVERHVLAAVDAEQRFGGVDDPAADDLLRADDDRADRGEVGRDRASR